MNDTVNCWQEEVIIPTYEAGLPDKNPMFLEKRVYQGSSGVVYPHPIIEKISDEKKDVAYIALFLENQYIKVMVLPELGGRIQMAFDKIKNRHFIYYNRVIKPALVGLTGPWISGGIEFNWPQHHRPSTFDPVDFLIKHNADGSKTIWVNEVERMFHTKGMAGFTLYPGKAFIEVKVKLYNRTPLSQSFLWWANPAVKVNDDYQSVFPPDVFAVFDHGKRDVTEFPIAKGVYYKVDYSPGTDISRYRNIPVPMSYMAINSKYDFIGGYEHDTRAGLLHIADHHISPGKKQWTWGCGEFGKTWDCNLTDDDGPYIELMTGVFTDNQPDFSWIQPYEEKSFVQYFMPYREVGMVKNASKDLMLGLEIKDLKAEIKVFSTSQLSDARICLLHSGNELFCENALLSPENVFSRGIPLPVNIQPADISLVVFDHNGKEILSCQETEKKPHNIPPPAEAAKKPHEIENNEQLYLTGSHLEQYRHATYNASEYYEEALKRDPGDARCNNAMGLWYLRKGRFADAERYFRNAIATLTRLNPNPYDCEPFFNLGLALNYQGKSGEAYDAFYKSTWCDAWQHAGFLKVATLATKQGNFEQAQEFIQKSLVKNYNSQIARHLKAVLLRLSEKQAEAEAFLLESLELDPFNFGCLFEKYLALKHKAVAASADVSAQLKELSRGNAHNFIEYALDYVHAGLYADATQFLWFCSDDKQQAHTLIPYYLGWFAFQNGEKEKAADFFIQAAELSPDYIFPDRLEEILVFEIALELNPADWKAFYYLGNLWYSKREYNKAVYCWESTCRLNNQFPTAHRNLALAYFNKLNNPLKALAYMETAFSLNASDARVLMELDQLYKKLNKNPAGRLILLEENISLVNQRDDLYLERITLYNQSGNYQKACELLASHRFHPWEGGEGKVVGQYLLCHIELAKQLLENNQPPEALTYLRKAEKYPLNLGEGKLYGICENDIHYLEGLSFELMGQPREAALYFQLATAGNSEPVQAVFYNDPQPDKIFYQGLAWKKLGNQTKAEAIFRQLIDFGEKHMNDNIEIDYFAVSLPDMHVFDTDLNLRNRIHCLYMTGLGYSGLGDRFNIKARENFDRVIELDINHQGALVHRKLFINFPVFSQPLKMYQK